MKYYIFFFLFVFSTINIFSKGRVILLDGTSSAGKTSIGRNLKNILGEDWEFIYSDIFDWNLIAQWAEDNYDCKLPRNDIEEIARQIKVLSIDVGTLAESFNEKIKLICKSDSDFYDEIKRLIDLDKNVICEDVIWSQESWNECYKKLGDDVVSVLVYCPFDMNAERINKRNTCENIVEYRSLSLFLEHHRLIFKPTVLKNEDVLLKVDQEDFYKVFKKTKDDYEKNIGIKKFYSVPIDKEDLIKDLDLKDKKKAFFTSRFHHDLTINTSYETSEQCAQKISDYFLKTQELHEKS